MILLREESFTVISNNMAKLILASSSPQRLRLLEQIGVKPDLIISPDIDESPLKKEKFPALASRLAEEKAMKIAISTDDAIILGGDSVVVCKGRNLEKAETNEQVASYLDLLSGGRARVYSAVCIIRKFPDGTIKKSSTIATAIVKIKRLTEIEKQNYINLGEGIGKAGGFAIDGFAAGYVEWVRGSYTGVIGMPLYETRNMLISIGYKF